MTDTVVLNVFQVLGMLIGVGIALLPFYIIYHAFKRGGVKLCTECGHEGRTRMETKGSIFIEIILWLCLVVPGLIYSIWRMGTKHEVCSSCGSSKVIPLDSPVAHRMRAELKLPAKVAA